MSRRSIRIAIAAMALALVPAAEAEASWNATGANSARGYSKAQSLATGLQPTASVNGRNVTVSWASPSSGAPITGYVVQRYTTGGVAQTIGASCSGTVAATSCTETSVPSGSWRYSVTPARANWRGAESPQSAIATVGTPALSLDQASVSTLPAALTGQITDYAGGQSVTFRLDNAVSGTVLSGSITPSPVPTGGTATVAVTLPAGTATGSHTIFAIGSAGDTASAPISVLTAQTVTTTAWDLGDASGGGAEVNASDPIAFAGGPTVTTTPAPILFSPTRYLLVDYNSALPSNASPASASFDFRFASSLVLANACFYFDVRRASTDAVLATHGSSGSPVGCNATTTLQTFSTSLPEVTSQAIANDLRVRVYISNSLLLAARVDQATITTATSQGSFTLYDDVFTDRVNGGTTNRTWPLVAAGGTAYTSDSSWLTAFNSARYLKLTYPSYVPSGSTISSVAFAHGYRATSATGQACVYYEILQGATVLATKGSAASPYSCTGTTYVTDSFNVPEIDTVAEANNVAVKIYVRNSAPLAGNRFSEHDLAEMTINYGS